jgi:cellobiose phosphorylase
MIMAYAQMGDRAKVWELLDMVMPIHHGRTKEEVAKYKAEPYVVAADVYAIAEHAGRGGWTWYTGSAGWMYQLIIEYMCGLKRKGEMLRIEPCLPPHWDEVTIKYKFNTADYILVIHQSTGDLDSKSVMVDGIVVQDGAVKLEDDGREHKVEVNIQYKPGGNNIDSTNGEMLSLSHKAQL